MTSIAPGGLEFAQIVAAAQISHKQFYPYGPFVSITLAQWADESGWGAHQSGINNFFGIKATPEEIASGAATRRTTKEYLNGRYYTLQQYFANYPTLAAGFSAHAQLLVSHHYLACMRAATPPEYAEALHACGYATEPRYAGILMSIINDFSLTQYDQRF